MYATMSRHERLTDLCNQEALKGKFNARAVLYPTEMKRIEKQWDVHVTQIEPEEHSKDKFLCLISWDTAFAHQLNYLQSWYILGVNEDCPTTETVAQRLFLISVRNSK